MAVPWAVILQDHTAAGIPLTGPCPLMEDHVVEALNKLQHKDLDNLQHIEITNRTASFPEVILLVLKLLVTGAA